MSLLCYVKHSFYVCMSVREGKYGYHVGLKVWEEAEQAFPFVHY